MVFLLKISNRSSSVSEHCEFFTSACSWIWILNDQRVYMVYGSQKKPSKVEYPGTVFNGSQDAWFRMYLLHLYSLLAVLRIAGSLPTSPTPCATTFPGCRACFSTGWLGVTLRLILPISDPSSRHTSLPSPSPGLIVFYLTGGVWSHSVSPFSLGRPESLFWAFFIVCQERAVASSSHGALLLVDHSMFSASCSALLCKLINVGMEQHEQERQ